MFLFIQYVFIHLDAAGVYVSLPSSVSFSFQDGKNTYFNDVKEKISIGYTSCLSPIRILIIIFINTLFIYFYSFCQFKPFCFLLNEINRYTGFNMWTTISFHLEIIVVPFKTTLLVYTAYRQRSYQIIYLVCNSAF